MMENMRAAIVYNVQRREWDRYFVRLKNGRFLTFWGILEMY